jgi:diacylglycerol kinase (ATP)
MPALRPATLIYNPHAGRVTLHEQMRKVANFWLGRGWQVDLQPTRAAGHATQLARHAAAHGHEMVLAAGGDGTLNEVANGLVGSNTVMAPLPVGTANSFAKELGLPRPPLLDLLDLRDDRLLVTAEKLAHGRVQRMDVGQTTGNNGRYWLLWVGAGFDGYVVQQIEPRSKNFKRLGVAGYAAKGLFFLPGFKSIRALITIDEELTLQDDYLLINISNCRLFGGGEFMLNAQGVLDDGWMEVWLFREKGWQWSDMLHYLLEVSFANHAANPNIEMIPAQRITVQTDRPMPYHLDAEPAGQTPFSVVVQPQALRLLVPPSAPPDLFSLPSEPL